MIVCPACYYGFCSECVGQGCYCDCQPKELLFAEQRATFDYEREYGAEEGEGKS